MKSSLKVFGDLLRNLRESKGYSQISLEKILKERYSGNSPWLGKTLSRFETGKIKKRSDKHMPLVLALDQLLEANGELLKAYDGQRAEISAPSEDEVKILRILELARIIPEKTDYRESVNIITALAGFFVATGIPVLNDDTTKQFVIHALLLKK